MSIFEQKKILNIEMIYEEFSWVIDTCWNNDGIRKYVNLAREKDWDVYDKAQYIADECKKFGMEKIKKNRGKNNIGQ